MSKLALFGGEPTRKSDFPSWPVFDHREEQAVLDVMRSGQWWAATQTYKHAEGSEFSSKVDQFETEFAAFQGARFGLACGSGTAALEVALKAAGVGPGDEVIVPPYTFLATASAVLLLGAIPVFCDIEPDTLNLDPARVEEAITPYTKAIIPVHFAGLAADLDRLTKIARANNLFLLEDAAHAHGVTSNGKHLGTFGDASIFSFQAWKNMTAGEGGIILTGNEDYAELCSSYIWGGRKVGQPWYEHYRLGWNHRLTEFQAAILREQLKRLPQQMAARTANGLLLNQQLQEIPGIRPLAMPPWATQHGFHLYIFRIDAEVFGVSRKDFIAALQQEGIPCSGGYSHPLYKNPMFLENNFHANGAPLSPREARIDFAKYTERCPAAEQACRETVWIQHSVLLGRKEDVEDIPRAVEKIYHYRHEFRSQMASR